jgi:uncharacterized protein
MTNQKITVVALLVAAIHFVVTSIAGHYVAVEIGRWRAIRSRSVAHRWLLLSRQALLVAALFAGPAAGSPLEDGLLAYKRGDYATALESWRPLAEEGNARAQLYLGILNRDGKGLVKDEAQAVGWFRKAAEQENPDAQSELGHMYETARGIAWDDSQAVQWYRKSAQQGNPIGQFRLGGMYARGRGVSMNATRAVAWYREAARHGYAVAQNALGYMYAQGRGVIKDDAQALEWYQKAAAQGNADAEANLGNVYAQGRGVTKDEAEAALWYRKAAEQGNTKAAILLSSLDTRSGEAGLAPDTAPPISTVKHDTNAISTIAPEYPLNAIQGRVTGRVVARMLIDENGSVIGVQIDLATPPRVFDDAVRVALREWKFKACGEQWVAQTPIDFSF